MLAITDADGFVGSALCLEAAARGIRVRTLTRRGLPCLGSAEHRGIGDLADATIADGLFDEVDTVIHCAAKVHLMERAQPGICVGLVTGLVAWGSALGTAIILPLLAWRAERRATPCRFGIAQSPDNSDGVIIPHFKRQERSEMKHLVQGTT